MTLVVEAGGRRVEVTRPDKVLFPGDGVTKADLARYYAEVSGAMLVHLRDRPLNLHRFPDGIEAAGFFQQHASPWFPRWMARATVEKRGGSVTHVVACRPADLVYLASQAVVALHVWPARTDRLERPDRLVFDLDPSREQFATLRAVARELGELLRELGLEPFAMATGSRGLHVTVALQRRSEADEVRALARGVAEVLVARQPDVLTLEQRKAKRGGRILVDVMRSRYAHTAIAPYSVRPRPRAPVATPLAWEELSDGRLRADRWTLRTLPRRLAERGDPWFEIAATARSARGALRRLEPLLAELSG